jgi:hypothetical protein
VKQLSLVTYPDFLEAPSSPIERAFVEFHRANPHVYGELERLALRLWDRRHPPRIGVKMLWETMRYNVALRTEPTDEFKLNNNFHALYARLLVFRQPQLAGVIELRERREEG